MTEFKYIFDDLKENVTEDYLREIAYQLKRIADNNDAKCEGGENGN